METERNSLHYCDELIDRRHFSGQQLIDQLCPPLEKMRDGAARQNYCATQTFEVLTFSEAVRVLISA